MPQPRLHDTIIGILKDMGRGIPVPPLNRVQTLHVFLDRLVDEIDERYGEGEGKQPVPSDVDLDQALAHAGDIARLLRVDAASLATRPEDRAQGGPEQPAQR